MPAAAAAEPGVRRRMSRFPAVTWAFPIEDVGRKPERVIKRRVDVELGDSAMTLGNLRVPYTSIQSAELQSGGVWPFRSYAIALVVGDEVIVVSVPAHVVAKGFPFRYSEQHVTFGLRWWTLRLFLLWLLLSLLVVGLLSVVFYLFVMNRMRSRLTIRWSGRVKMSRPLHAQRERHFATPLI